MAHAHSIATSSTLYDPLLSCCNAAELLRLSRTSQTMRHVVQDFMRRGYNLDQSLQVFFHNSVGFHIIQSYTGAVISGSFALGFFTRTSYFHADLDIYVASSRRKQVGDWLVSNGYVYIPATQSRGELVLTQPEVYEEAIVSLDMGWMAEHFHCEGVLGVLNFFQTIGGVEKKVQVIVTDICPIRTILNFHSSS